MLREDSTMSGQHPFRDFDPPGTAGPTGRSQPPPPDFFGVFTGNILALFAATAVAIIAAVVLAYVFRRYAEEVPILVVLGVGLVTWAATAIVIRLAPERAILYAVCGVMVWFGWGAACQGFGPWTVHVDNFSEHDVELLLDGKPWMSCASDSMQTGSLAQGKYTLTVEPAGGGARLDEMVIEVGLMGPFVLNVLGAQSYCREVIEYSINPQAAGARQVTVLNDRWFAARADYVFEEPPAAISVPNSQDRVRKVCLWRGLPFDPNVADAQEPNPEDGQGLNSEEPPGPNPEDAPGESGD
jgi:hypothetical protein